MDVAILGQPGETIRPPIDGGSSITIISHQLARRVAEQGEATIFSRTSNVRPEEELDEYGVRYRRVPDLGDRWNRPVRLLERALGPLDERFPFYASRWFRRSYARRVIRELGAYDVLHVHNYSQFVSQARRRHPNLGIVLHMHCNWLAQLDADRVEQRIRASDAVIGCSDFVSEAVRGRFPHLADRVRTVRTGVDTEFFRPDGSGRISTDSQRRLLMVGRLSPEKGVHVFAKALRPLLRKFPDLHVDLIGGKGFLPYEYLVGLANDEKVAALERFYGSSTLSRIRRRVIDGPSRYLAHVDSLIPESATERVTFRGTMGHRALRTAYHRADVLVNASLSEALGLPILEAMSSGLPVVTTSAGGQTDLVEDGTTGLIVPPGDPEALARTLEELLRSPETVRSMGRAARRRILRRFSWKRMIDRFLGVYERAVRTAQARSAPISTPNHRAREPIGVLRRT